MHCDCSRARREARAEAFEEAAAYCAQGSDILFVVRQRHAEWVMVKAAEHFAALAAAERLARDPKPPVRYTETPEPHRASSGPWSAREGITDCVEDGWTTAHVTGWPDSYPFEALDPMWPDNPAEACK
jgi:hypothetical protein